MRFSLARMLIAVAWFAAAVFFIANTYWAKEAAKTRPKHWVCMRVETPFDFPSPLLALPALRAGIATLSESNWQRLRKTYLFCIIVAIFVQLFLGGRPPGT